VIATALLGAFWGVVLRRRPVIAPMVSHSDLICCRCFSSSRPAGKARDHSIHLASRGA
jgi:hypothetical protein